MGRHRSDYAGMALVVDGIRSTTAHGPEYMRDLFQIIPEFWVREDSPLFPCMRHSWECNFSEPPLTDDQLDQWVRTGAELWVRTGAELWT